MHIEIQMALNFVISYLYNKLPRRRVNLFGEELEKALKDRFQGHWYPEKPFKGSAFRCIKTGEPTDAVLDRAARESGVPIADILENLPTEMAVWVDPGEVSYRVGEKGGVKILYSELNNVHDDTCADREVTKTFNPEAPCFRPIDAVGLSMGALSLSPKRSPPNGNGGSPPNGNGVLAIGTNNGHGGGMSPTVGHNGQHTFGIQQQQQQQLPQQLLQQQPQQHQQQQHQLQHQQQQQQAHHHHHHHQQQQQQQQQPQQHHQHQHQGGKSVGNVHNNIGSNHNINVNNANGSGNGNGNAGNTSGGVVGNNSKQMAATSPAPVAVNTAAFLPRSQAPLTFTTATFAQTKFGSTKLKTSSKRANSNMLTALSIPRTRMSPTEFSNYIKQRAMQQQHLGHNQSHNGGGGHGAHHLGPIGSVSPSRSISPNPLAAAAALAAAHSPDPYYFGSSVGGGGGGVGGINGVNNLSPMSLYPPSFNGCGGGGGSSSVGSGRNLFDATTGDGGVYDGMFNNNNNIGNKFQSSSSANAAASGVAVSTANNQFLDTNCFFGLNGLTGLANTASNNNNNNIGNNSAAVGNGNVLLSGSVGSSSGLGAVGTSLPLPIGSNSGIGVIGVIGNNGGGQSSSSGDSSPSSSGSGSAADGGKLLDGLNSFYTSSGPYQHLLVAN